MNKQMKKQITEFLDSMDGTCRSTMYVVDLLAEEFGLSARQANIEIEEWFDSKPVDIE